MPARSTQQLIDQAAEDDRNLQVALERWQSLQSVRFADIYYKALRAHGVPEGKAQGIHAVIKDQVNKIADSLETASYVLKGLTQEIDAARRLVRNADNSEGQFTI